MKSPEERGGQRTYTTAAVLTQSRVMLTGRGTWYLVADGRVQQLAALACTTACTQTAHAGRLPGALLMHACCPCTHAAHAMRHCRHTAHDLLDFASMWLCAGLLLRLCRFVVVRFGFASLAQHCFLQLSSAPPSAGLLVVLVPGCCQAYSAFSV